MGSFVYTYPMKTRAMHETYVQEPGSYSTAVMTTLPQLVQNVSTEWAAATVRTDDERAPAAAAIIDDASDWPPQCHTEQYTYHASPGHANRPHYWPCLSVRLFVCPSVSGVEIAKIISMEIAWMFPSISGEGSEMSFDSDTCVAPCYYLAQLT